MSRQRFIRSVVGNAQLEVPDLEAMRQWLAAAQPGAYLEYHRGRNLAAERRDSADLAARADLVGVLADRLAIAPAQRRITDLKGPLTAYGLTMVAPQRMPRSLVHGSVAPADYRVMMALVQRERDYVSIARCVRDALATSNEDRAQAWVDRARGMEWIEHTPNAGYTITAKGRAVLV